MAGLGEAKTVRICNRGTKVFDYVVMGERVTIPAGGSIERPRHVAVAIQGFYPGKDVPVSLDLEPVVPVKDANPRKESGSEPDEGRAEDNPVVEKERIYACPQCPFETVTKPAYLAHMKKHRR